MDALLFTQVIPRIRVLETRLLDKTKLDRMIDSSSPLEALKILEETEYSIFMSKVKRPEDYEILLSNELKRVYHLLYEISPVKSLVNMMSLKYDYHNIKVMIKGKILNKDFTDIIIPVGNVPIEKLKTFIDNEYYRDLNPIMRKAIEDALEEFGTNKDPQRIDIILDKYMFEQMLSLNKEIGDEFLDKYLKSLIDLNNIKTLLRVKKQNKDKNFFTSVIISGGFIDKDKLITLLNDSVENIPAKLSYTDYGEVLRVGIDAYSKTGSINIFEKLSDNFIMEYMKRAKYISFGPEPIISYLYAKENEIKVIRIIMIGKLNNMKSEIIRERLRDIYV
ncbi:V-type ATP synthase subunit C [Clostridium sporogenes]|uniref:V-type ATP synthase subunit C n=1 Tax=Clostridium sporogenes TaxID=1509 RepID=UPI0022384C36|nr:V-type ATP synthase subunit C [Clostridium sporogenes]EKS4342834.1 V-type ATP synthase subunit C [Clostridium botulinum]EKS4393298.1 V-type ATP synthase subunit C [Clostridium botulinum]MCW6079179.1 V-type ATP synthase subunit C [Clostridium sporogenes]